jgi:hypothetical protein
MRYARYCVGWVLGLLLPFLILVATAPNAAAFPMPFSLLLMFFYIGLPLGLGVAILAAFGYFVGGIWSNTLESSPRVALNWPKAKETLKALVLVPVLSFGIFAIARGLIDKEVLIFAKGNGLPMVSLAQDPFAYLISMVIWCAVSVGLVVYLYRELRKTYAT